MTTLTFLLDGSAVLNSNVTLHRFTHGKLVANLRALAADQGQVLHPAESQEAVTARRQAIAAEKSWTLMKSRARTKRKKDKTNKLTLKEINALVEAEYLPQKPALFKDAIEVPFLFERFRLVATVYPPTRRRMDPPNLYPTVKALVDGLTDAALWRDDDFSHMGEMTFRYGGTSGVSKQFRLDITIEELSLEEWEALAPASDA